MVEVSLMKLPSIKHHGVSNDADFLFNGLFMLTTMMIGSPFFAFCLFYELQNDSE